MVADRLWRTLSAFNRSTRRWTPIPLRNAQSQVTQRFSQTSPNIDTFWTQRLSLISWNIDAFSSRPVTRAKLILGHILEGPKYPDIIFLQEVTPDVRASLLDDARVRAAFLVTDAEDQTSFEDVPFVTMTLLLSVRFASGLDSQKEGDKIERGGKFMLGRVSRVTLQSKYRRDALYVDIIPPTAPGTVFRLINVHLDSLADTLRYRAQQMEILANVLREPGCSGGIIAGDFNAISPEDDGLVDKNGLVDAWVALHGREDPGGATWGVGVERRDRLGPGRLDKVAMMGLKAEEMEVLRPGHIEVPRPGEKSVEIPWSDHCGLRCIFAI
ncbi:Endonuclease/exonuclease/phosphatase [Suillus clintonianus]|uniref:Endonuclease/exonuclease/phosphatase n=1 Tax=Suillus clintonianus TaxID=1904413 RepID=UPI001B88198C|nr:Endonuclease/exonuclease/phosphatase [Suillus clintonianus]KAG2124895.1 Endonuclease/exonuclease/phosphatase [Suillus clintonianus]